jgi:hypothetical protein
MLNSTGRLGACTSSTCADSTTSAAEPSPSPHLHRKHPVMSCIIHRLDVQQHVVIATSSEGACCCCCLAGKVAVVAACGPRSLKAVKAQRQAQACGQQHSTA